MVRRRRANAATEFALILPIWLAIIFAIAEFGWLFFRYTALDAAAEAGCRAGSLVDPGENDTYIAIVRARATARMNEILVALGNDDCSDCAYDLWTTGEPPSRTLVCVVEKPFTPLLGLYLDPMTVKSVQITRLEWQREGAP